MIGFPNAKINIGLNIVGKRSDGFHNLETVFYPLPWREPLEIILQDNVVGKSSAINFSSSGIQIHGDLSENLCVKAYRLLSDAYELSSVKMHLHKILPIGAGLGGGSSDAAYTIKMLNELFRLEMTSETMQEYARRLGSDCAFFIENKPVYAFGKGDVFKPIQLDLSNYFIALVKPSIHISTAEAYSGVVPETPDHGLTELMQLPVKEWKGFVINDFESSIFKNYPEIEKIKNKLYDKGAVYAAMTGSGSTVYGLFHQATDFKSIFNDCIVWEGILS